MYITMQRAGPSYWKKRGGERERDAIQLYTDILDLVPGLDIENVASNFISARDWLGKPLTFLSINDKNAYFFGPI